MAASARPNGVSAGERLGRYELIRLIGGGGFATVWAARLSGAAGFEREVAIKIIHPERAADPRFRAMFLDEARLAARIMHPNVAQIWELGDEGGRLFLAMEYVDGDSLGGIRSRCEARRIRPRIGTIVRILADACAGLHAAHVLEIDGKPLGIVHRDVSPQNILVTKSGIAKVIDFGIAKAAQRFAGPTTTGFTKGKVSYMSPEQASAADVDERADVWAIGAVAYDLLEGHPPFDGPNDLARLNALVRGGLPAPFSSEVPEPIERTIFKALDRDLEKRYRTAAELRDAFETALAESGMRTSHDDVAQDLKSLWSSELMVEAPSDRSDGPSVRDLLLPQGQPTTEARAIPESVSLPLVPAPIRGRRVALGVVGVLTAAGLAAWWSSTKPNETESSRTRPTESTAPAPSSVPLPAASLPAPQDTPSASSAAASAQPSAAPAPPAALPSATAPTPMPARKSAAKPAATAGPTTKPRSTTPKPTATDDEDGIF